MLEAGCEASSRGLRLSALLLCASRLRVLLPSVAVLGLSLLLLPVQSGLVVSASRGDRCMGLKSLLLLLEEISRLWSCSSSSSPAPACSALLLAGTWCNIA